MCKVAAETDSAPLTHAVEMEEVCVSVCLCDSVCSVQVESVCVCVTPSCRCTPPPNLLSSGLSSLFLVVYHRLTLCCASSWLPSLCLAAWTWTSSCHCPPCWPRVGWGLAWRRAPGPPRACWHGRTFPHAAWVSSTPQAAPPAPPPPPPVPPLPHHQHHHHHLLHQCHHYHSNHTTPPRPFLGKVP